MIKVLNAVLAIVAGVGGALLLYWLLNKFAERLPGSWEDRVKPWVFVGPAVVVIGLFLIYPALRTLVLSFANAESTAWVGFSNYADLLSSRDFIFVTLLNTLLWIAVVPVAVVVVVVGGVSSRPSDASRNSRTPLPRDENTWGSLPAPKIISTMIKIRSNSIQPNDPNMTTTFPLGSIGPGINQQHFLPDERWGSCRKRGRGYSRITY